METKNRRYQYGNSGTSSSYVYGNTVRKLNAEPDIRREEQPYELPSPGRHRQSQPRTLQGISFTSLLVLSAAIIITLYVCVEYLKLQAGVSEMEKSIVSREHTLVTMSNENDAAYEQINITYDLDYVYKVAVEELGMVYPNKNTVITYQAGTDDYVRQYEDIPE